MDPVILNILDSFNCVRLEEIDREKLMDRIDTKYLLPANRVPDLLNLMKGRYRALEISTQRISSYSTIYFDTHDFTFFNQHVTERTGRFKVRFRTYNSTGNTFLEIKKKTRKGRTVKWRIENSPAGNSFNETAREFIQTRAAFDPGSLNPVLENHFTRMTFTGFDTPERITLDLDLSFRSPEGKSAELPMVAILELKSQGVVARSPFSGLIKQFSVYPTPFSKYCTGCAILYDLPLKSILKPIILLLNRIENEYNKSLSA